MLIFRKLISDERVEHEYVKIGSWVGNAVSMLCYGEAVGMERKVNQWERWEEEYARRGYRTVSLDKFIDLGGHGKVIDDVIGQRYMFNEKPKFHAKIYKHFYLGKVEPALDLEQMMRDGQPQMGTWEIPSTESKAL